MLRWLVILALFVALLVAAGLGLLPHRQGPAATAPHAGAVGSDHEPPVSLETQTNPRRSRIRPTTAVEPSRNENEDGKATAEEHAIIEIRNSAGELLEDAYFSVDGNGLGGGRGEVRASPGKAAEVLVKGKFYAVKRTITLDPGLHTIVVSVDARVSGRITVNGSEPECLIPLRLVSDSYSWFHDDTSTDAEGRFQFRHLPLDWSGIINIPREYRLASDEGVIELPQPCSREFHHWLNPSIVPSVWEIKLAQPAAGLEIRLVDATAVAGRLHRGGNGWYGGGFAEITVGGEQRRFRFMTGSPVGRFCVNVPPDAERVALHVFGLDCAGNRRLEIEGPFQGLRDLGDIELSPYRQIDFQVLDELGQPLGGAKAVVPGTTNRSGATDVTGGGHIQVDHGVEQVLIGKPGFRPAVVPINAESDGPIVVSLQANTLLDVEIKLADGTTPQQGRLYVRVSSDSPLFEPLPHDAGWLYHVTSSTGWIDEYDLADGGPRSIDLLPDREGRVLVPALRPLVRLSVELRARGEEDPLDQASLIVAPLEELNLRLRAPTAERVLEGTVIVADGEVAAGAKVIVVAPLSGATIAEIEVERDGSFRLENVFESSVCVRINRPGCAELSTHISLASSDPHAFVLARFRR